MLCILTIWLAGCAQLSTQLNPTDLTGEWSVHYRIPDSQQYRIPLTVKIGGTDLPDQGSESSFVREGIVSGDVIKFRWVQQGKYGERNEILRHWDYYFTGKLEFTATNSFRLVGTLTGSDLDGMCEFANPNNESKKDIGFSDCARRKVTGTWYAYKSLN